MHGCPNFKRKVNNIFFNRFFLIYSFLLVKIYCIKKCIEKYFSYPPFLRFQERDSSLYEKISVLIHQNQIGGRVKHRDDEWYS